jgi:hypothetical protein
MPPASERPQNHILDRATNEVGLKMMALSSISVPGVFYDNVIYFAAKEFYDLYFVLRLST